MANLVKKSFDKPDDLVAPDKTRAEILEFGTIKAVKVTAQPGWTWSECIKPHVGGESCQAGHLGTCVQGSMRVMFTLFHQVMTEKSSVMKHLLVMNLIIKASHLQFGIAKALSK